MLMLLNGNHPHSALLLNSLAMRSPLKAALTKRLLKDNGEAHS